MAHRDHTRIPLITPAGDTTRISRRRLLQTGGALGALAAAATVLPAAASNRPVIRFNNDVNAQTETPKKGGTLKYGLSTDPSNFEPHISTGAASGSVKIMCYSTLLTYNPKGEIIGDLAEKFGWVDDKTYEVTLRKGVTFHNGDPLTPEDVIFSYNRIKDPKTAATNAPKFADVQTIEAANGNVVRFHLSQPNVVLPYTLADNNSMIVSKKWIESGVDPKTTMMGTGPFKFIERKPGISITLKRNDNYFLEGLPHLDGITFQPMADDNARVTALRSGSVDFIDYVPYTQMTVIQKSNDLVLQSDNVLGFGWVAFVADKAPVNDQRVRQAFAYGMDRDKMVEVAFSGHGAPITGGVYPEGWIGYSPDLANTYKPDYDKAKSLLKQAGHDPLDIDMLSTSTYSVIQRPAVAAQSELKKADINVKLQLQEWLTFRQTVQAGTYAVHAWGSSLGYNDPDCLSEWLTSTGFFGKQIHFKDDQIDKLFAEGRQTTDKNKRQEIYHDIEKRVLEVVPWTYTIRREQGEAHAKYVKGYNHVAAGGWTYITLRDIWLDK